MAQKRHYEVRIAFPARESDGTLVWINRSTAHRIDELLTDKQIKEHLAAGDLVDNGAVTPETTASERRASTPK